MPDSSDQAKMGFNPTWSMAVGGMIGGGIFSTLGVLIGIAGWWAWLSFILAGLIALVTGYSYIELAKMYGEGGGAFTFLREINAQGFAGSLSWVLVIGYILTNSVYAYTFGQYLGNVVGLGPWFPRAVAVAIVAVFVLINLRGVGEAAGVEVFAVWFKLFVLIALAAFGLAQWDASMMTQGIESHHFTAALVGAASIFMAFEGFQLLTYDYDDIRDPERTLPRAVLSAIVVVIVVYVLVTLGTTMLVGAGTVVDQQEVALAVAGQAALGTTGLIVVTLAALFSTGSAINATLFATARLSHTVAKHGELPAALDHRNAAAVPDRAIITLGAASALLAAIGSLNGLVEAASLAFLFTFMVVNALAWHQSAGYRTVTALGVAGTAAAMIGLVWRLARSSPWSLAFLGGLIVLVTVGRHFILRHVNVEQTE